jgi:glucokinase
MGSQKPQIVLAGDIGGTKTRLGLFRFSKKDYHLLVEETFPSAHYRRLEGVLRDFFQGKEWIKGERRITSACFGVAGPVTSGNVKTTNLPWMIRTQSLQKELSIKGVELINDLVANAYGVSLLKRRDFQTLNQGRKRDGNAALLSAGTGLGEAILVWNGKEHVPSPSEGGHADFAPRDDLEIELLRFLYRHFGHVSYERVLSGEGLFHIYQFVKESKRFGDEPEWLTKKMREEDPAAVISDVARLKRNSLCVRALDLFASIYGAAAGNLALHVLSVGGIYLGGGIAPKIVWKLKDRTFMKAFKDKGRYSNFLSGIPVKVIMNEKTALLGAAYHAMELLGT